MSSIIGEAWVKVRPLLSGFTTELDTEVTTAARRAGTHAGEASGQAFSSGFAKHATRLAGVALGVTGLVEGIKTVVEAAANEEGQLALTEKAVTNVHAATTLYGQSITDLVQKQELQTGFSKEALLPAFTRLVLATHDTAKAYKDLTLAEDIARSRHIEVAQAALALGKAEQGSVTSLQRLGVILPENVKKLDANARATVALRLTSERYAGSAQAFAETGAGSLERIGASATVLEEALGSALLPEVTKVATAAANYFSKAENLEKIQRDVSEGAQAIATGFHAAGEGLKVVRDVAGPVVSALGGVDRTLEVIFGALAARKILASTSGVLKWAATVNAAETEVAIATGREAAATTAATAASERQIAIYGARGQVLTTVAVREAELGTATALAGAESQVAAKKIGGSAGLYGATLLASYGISTLILKATGLDDTFKSLGDRAGGFAEKLGLVASESEKGALGAKFSEATLTKLAAAYQKVAAIAPSGGGIGKQARDDLIAKLVGPGFTFNDAQIANRSRLNQRINANTPVTTVGAGGGPGAPRPTDLDFQLSLQEALQTKSTADELELFRSRSAYLALRIRRLREDTSLTTAQKKTLLSLEKSQADVEGSITSITKQTADAAKKRADDARQAAEKARQAYSESVSTQEQLLQVQNARAQLTVGNLTDDRKASRATLDFYRTEANDAKLTQQQRIQYQQAYLSAQQQIIETDRAGYREQLSMQEQRLQLAATRAQLTQKSVADDRAAARRLIAFYERESKDAKLTAAERLQFKSQAIQERVTLQGIGQQGAGGATAAQIFAEAGSQFRTFGSNIAGRGGVLSGQDARASFAARVLGSQSATSLAAFIARQQAQRDGQRLSEAQKQTALLRQIARGVGANGTPKATADAINRARKASKVVAG